MSMPSNPPGTAPGCDPTVSVLAAVRAMLREADRGWLLLRTFFLASTAPSYRRAAPTIPLNDATAVRKRVEALHKLLRRETGRDVILVVSDGRRQTLTGLGRAVLEEVRPTFKRR